MSLNKADLKSCVITMFLIFCVFLATGSIVPAWCEEQASFKSVETGESSSVTPWTADHIRKRPYLIYSKRPNAMTVLWQTYQTPAQSTIEWGITTSYGRGPVTVHEDGNSSDKHQFSHTISNLLPATKYYYRVINDTYSHTGSFITAPRPGETTLSFYGYGDTRAEYLNPPVDHNAVLSALLADMDQNPAARQTLLVHLGDYVYNGLNEFLWDTQQFNLEPAYDAMHSTFANLPLMGVLGNHEGYDAYAAKRTVMNFENMGQLFRKYYPYEYPNKNRFYHSFDYGPVHFVIVDTWSYEGASSEQQTIDAVQANWLKRDLRASRKPWKIAMLHTPIWQCLQGNQAMQAQLTPILKDGGVHMVLQGHQHYYSRAETEGPYSGMTWLVLGGGGAPIIPETSCVAETNKKWPPFAAFKFHFARFDISGNAMIVTVIDKDGTIIETFQITN